MKKSVFVILLVLFISAFSISMYFVVKETIEDKKQYEVFENIVSSVHVEDDSSDYTDEKFKRYVELNTENSDFVGWIKIDGTHINYPVMKSSTPDYYLHRNFNKKYSYYGTPYLSDKSDTMNPTDNIVIYGHNMRDNTMFGDLSKYKSKEFYEKHRYIHFDTLVDLGKYEIVCVFKTTPCKFDYQNYTVFDSSDEFNSYISKCEESEYYNTDVSCGYGDKLITLSTCEYCQENGRLGLQMYIKLLQVQEALHIVLYVPLICGQYQVIGAKFLLVQQSMDILQVNTVMLAFISATVWLHIT